jgi:hypothetical protein
MRRGHLITLTSSFRKGFLFLGCFEKCRDLSQMDKAGGLLACLDDLVADLEQALGRYRSRKGKDGICRKWKGTSS